MRIMKILNIRNIMKQGRIHGTIVDTVVDHIYVIMCKEQVCQRYESDLIDLSWEFQKERKL